MTVRRFFAASIAATMFVATADAHHSWARYDGENVITIEDAVITKVDWANPHVVMNFEVKNAAGAMDEWIMEMDPPTLLLRFGMRHDSVTPGMHVTITGVPARSGAKMMRAVMIKLPDGTTQRTSSRV